MSPLLTDSLMEEKLGHRAYRYPRIFSDLLCACADYLTETFYEFEIGLQSGCDRLQGQTQHLFLLRAFHLTKNRLYQDPRISRRPGTKTE